MWADPFALEQPATVVRELFDFARSVKWNHHLLHDVRVAVRGIVGVEALVNRGQDMNAIFQGHIPILLPRFQEWPIHPPDAVPLVGAATRVVATHDTQTIHAVFG